MQNISTALSVRSIASSIPTRAPSTSSLEGAIGIKVLNDLDEQLSRISGEMQAQLQQKTELRQNLSFLLELDARTSSPLSSNVVELSEKEKQQLIEMGLPLNTIASDTNGTSFTISKKILQPFIEKTQQEISGMNSNSELVMIQVQSLVDQRKSMLSLISNLLSSKNEGLMNIIRNLKN